MKKKILGGLLLIAIGLLLPIKTVRATEVEQRKNVEYTEADTNVVPDKYNTGCKGELLAVEMPGAGGTELDGVLFIAGSNSTKVVLDFYWRNKEVTGTVIFENYDFSANPFTVYNADKVERKIKIVFNNCKFSSVSVGRIGENITYEFNNCFMNSFYGSNSTLNWCQLGKSYSDGVVPFRNIQVNNCFFTDMASMVTDKAAHIDGTQLYGNAETDVENVYYNNCRFEIPPMKPEGTSASVNACIMLQLEFSNGKNIGFTDCIVNGGGYSIYARGKDDTFTFENVSFDGIRFGDARKHGVVYPKMHKDITFYDVAPTDSLYIGSVWKEEGETHFSVTNDTNRERILLVHTDKGTYNYTIPACPLGSTFTSDMTYDELPFDIDIVVPVDCDYAVCFDNTVQGLGKQIRFINWRNEDVYLTEEVEDTVLGGENDILVEGKCGNGITFTLTKAGLLTLMGTGDTYNFHSQKFPDWNDYKDYIKEVRVEDGITGLGSMIFRNCVSLQKVTLPNSLTTIGQYAFGGCVGLSEITLPANLTTLGKNVFSGTIMNAIYYDGDNWESIEMGTGNENLLEKLVLEKEPQKVTKTTKVKVAKVKKLKVKKKSKTSIKINWKRIRKVNGYQIAIKMGKKGKFKKIKLIKKNKKTSFVKKKLKRGKKYYVKVRAYKLVNGKRVYGKYSAIKKIRLR